MATAEAERGGERSRWDDYGPDPDSEWRRIDWREHLRSIAVEGARVNLVDIGSGPAVVFVHGLGANWQCWLENIPHFAEANRVIALDLPGFGFSEMPAEAISINGYAGVVAAVLRELGVERASVVGNSMGGFVACEMAVSFPERVERIALVAAAVLWRERRRARPTVVFNRLTSAFGAKAAAQWQLAVHRPKLRVPALAWAGVRHPRKIPVDLAYEIMQASGAPGWPDALRALYDYELRDRLPDIDVPTLIVWGAFDPLVPVQHAFELERLIPDSRVIVFPDTGHEPMFERPERFNRALDAFLADDVDAVARISA